MDKKPDNTPQAAAQNETNPFLKVHQQALERRRLMNQQANARREKTATEIDLPRDDDSQ